MTFSKRKDGREDDVEALCSPTIEFVTGAKVVGGNDRCCVVGEADEG